MIRIFYCLLTAILLLAGAGMLGAAMPQSSGESGKITIPRDFELDTMMDTVVLSGGEYNLGIYNEGVGLSYRDKQSGLEIAYTIPFEAEKTKDDVHPMKVDVSVIKEEGVNYVRIRAYLGSKTYTSLLRCAIDGKPEIMSAESRKSLDPRIIAELETIRESIALMDKFAGAIWPDWTEYRELSYSMIFPNRTKLLVTDEKRLPAAYKLMDISMPGGKKVYVNRSKEIPGRLDPFAGYRAGGDFNGVGITFTGNVNPGKDESPNAKEMNESEAVNRFGRMMTYVHEAFHVLQAKRGLQAQMKGLMKNLVMPDRSYVPTLAFSLHSEIEGEALIKALAEDNNANALGYFKDFLVARELKLKEMPASAAAFDARNTRAEGSASYAALKMAMLVRDADLARKSAEAKNPMSATLARAGEYLNREMRGVIDNLKGNTFDVFQKHYIYGAYWCFLMDRFSPSWKQGLFENDRLLDEATADFLKMTEVEKTEVAERLKTDFDYEKIKARHQQIIVQYDESISSVEKRKGRVFLIDLNHAQRSVDINPRQFIFYKGNQLYPRGLFGFVFGSLKLKSEETPMRLNMKKNQLEWIDADAKPGQKGYDLKYQSQEGDLYKDVTLTTKGFSMTAKAIKLADDGNTVKISIWD